MTSGKDRILSLGPQRKILSEEQVARSVVVTNLKRQTLAEVIVIYFQQAKNGGGELECVHIPHEGKAVITFASKEGMSIMSIYFAFRSSVIVEKTDGVDYVFKTIDCLAYFLLRSVVFDGTKVDQFSMTFPLPIFFLLLIMIDSSEMSL